MARQRPVSCREEICEAARRKRWASCSRADGEVSRQPGGSATTIYGALSVVPLLGNPLWSFAAMYSILVAAEIYDKVVLFLRESSVGVETGQAVDGYLRSEAMFKNELPCNEHGAASTGRIPVHRDGYSQAALPPHETSELPHLLQMDIVLV